MRLERVLIMKQYLLRNPRYDSLCNAPFSSKCILQSPLFDLASLDEFPLLNEKTTEMPKRVNLGKKKPKTSWRKMEWQHLFHVCIMSLLCKDCQCTYSLGCVPSYWIKEKEDFMEK